MKATGLKDRWERLAKEAKQLETEVRDFATGAEENEVTLGALAKRAEKFARKIVMATKLAKSNPMEWIEGKDLCEEWPWYADAEGPYWITRDDRIAIWNGRDALNKGRFVLLEKQRWIMSRAERSFPTFDEAKAAAETILRRPPR